MNKKILIIAVLFFSVGLYPVLASAQIGTGPVGNSVVRGRTPAPPITPGITPGITPPGITPGAIDSPAGVDSLQNIPGVPAVRPNGARSFNVPGNPVVPPNTPDALNTPRTRGLNRELRTFGTPPIRGGRSPAR